MWFTPVISIFQKLRQEEHWEFKASQHKIVSSRLAWIIAWDPIFKRTKTRLQKRNGILRRTLSVVLFNAHFTPQWYATMMDNFHCNYNSYQLLLILLAEYFPCCFQIFYYRSIHIWKSKMNTIMSLGIVIIQLWQLSMHTSYFHVLSLLLLILLLMTLELKV